MFKHAALAATLVAALPAAASADTAGANWSGFYAGAFGGLEAGHSYMPIGEPTSSADPWNDVAYGGFAGYNFAFGNGMVAGVEGVVSSGRVPYYSGVVTPAYDMGVIIDLKARLGYETGRSLVYVSGGWTDVQGSADWAPGRGWNAGLGVDVLMSDSFFVGAEYVFRDIKGTTFAWEDKYGTMQLRAGFKF
jgi:opacity protein-like surface antigen